MCFSAFLYFALLSESWRLGRTLLSEVDIYLSAFRLLRRVYFGTNGTVIVDIYL